MRKTKFCITRHNCHISNALLTSSEQLGKVFHYGIQALLCAAPTHTINTQLTMISGQVYCIG